MIEEVLDFLSDLQTEQCQRLENMDGEEHFKRKEIDRGDAGISRPSVLEGSGNIEKAAVNFTFSRGPSLPEAALSRRMSLAGLEFEAASLSTIIHPLNPFVPTAHFNVRFFMVKSDPIQWFFGGGFDLTPYYGFIEDSIEWHSSAKAAARNYYEQMKKDCDNYFYLTHRQEHRGIGGLFFDDWNRDGFEKSFQLVKDIGDTFMPSFQSIFERRHRMSFTDNNRHFQLHRRGRYVEFNLVNDRGTKYGLESGRRIESVLSSMPPLASWNYDFIPEHGSEEERLTSFFLVPRDWLKYEGK
jgi:coproporphyrinogen III oxidase